MFSLLRRHHFMWLYKQEDNELFREFYQEQRIVILIENRHEGAPWLDIRFLDDAYSF